MMAKSYTFRSLLEFAFAGCEAIRPGAAKTDVGSTVSINHVIATTAQDTVVATETVYIIRARTSQDQIVP